MYIQRVEVAGLAVAPTIDIGLDRVSSFRGPPRLRTAVADAVCLAFSAWDRRLLAAQLARWGCGDVVITGDPLPEGASWSGAPGLATLLDRPDEGTLTVSLTLQLDPPAYGRLRREAVRDPRLVDALAEGPQLVVRIGARFSPAFDALALDPLAFVVGDAAFPIAGADRPVWLTPFLRGLAGRCWRGTVAPEVWAERTRSWAMGDQLMVRRALAALRTSPAELPDVIILPDGLGVVEGERLVPLAAYGAGPSQAVGLVGAVHLSRADILLVDDPPPGWAAWFAAQAEVDGSPLEQVVLLGTPDGRLLGG